MRHLLSTAAIALAMTAMTLPASAQQQQQPGQCDRNFSAVDANGDGKVTNQEASAAIDDEFSRLDLDNSGSISKSEWQNCGWHTMMNTQRKNMQASDHAPMQGDAQQDDPQASAQQQSGTQQQETSQQQSAAQPGSQSGGQSMNQGSNQASPRPWTTDEQFSQADTNKDGSVDRQEAAEANERIYGRTISGSDKEQMARQSGARFATIDSNGDGSISQEEWQNRSQADIEAMYARMDRDDDGELSRSEYQRARQPQQQQEASRPVTIWYYYVH